MQHLTCAQPQASFLPEYHWPRTCQVLHELTATTEKPCPRALSFREEIQLDIANPSMIDYPYQFYRVVPSGTASQPGKELGGAVKLVRGGDDASCRCSSLLLGRVGVRVTVLGRVWHGGRGGRSIPT